MDIKGLPVGQKIITKLLKRTCVSALVGLAALLLASFFPATALATSIALPPQASIQNLGTPPTTHSSELFDSAPSYLGQIIDADRYFNTYSLNLDADVAYSFVVSDFEFDAFFLIADNTGNILLSSEIAQVSGNGLELRLVAPTAGVYYLIVSSVAGIEVGEYNLHLAPIANFSEVSGLVQGDFGQGLEDILVTAYRQRTTFQGIQYFAELSTVTQADGSYTLSPLIPGNYKISFRDLNFSYGHSYYYQQDTLDSAALLNIPTNASITLRTTTLVRAAAIVGTVTCEIDLPLEGIIASAYIEQQGSSFALASAETDADGNFAITGLRADTYYVSFSCPYGLYFTQYYDQVDSIASATPLTLTTSAVAENIDAMLVPTATISGATYDSTQNPIEDIVVSLLRLQDSTLTPQSHDCFEVIDQTITEDDGTFFFGRLSAGIYFLHFADPEARFLEVYYTDGFIPARASPLVLNDTQHLANRNVTLTYTSSLSGTVVDTSLNYLSGIAVRLFNLESAPNPITEEFLATPFIETHTDDDGNYYLADIPPGTYLLEFFDSTGVHITLYHFNHLDPNEANAVTITAGSHLTGHNTTMSPASQISGVVADEVSGTPLGRAQLFLFSDSSDLTPAHSIVARANGSFSFRGLESGTYYLGFIPEGYSLDNMQFFDRSYAIADATQITLATGEFLDLDHLLWMPPPTVTLTLEGQNNRPAQIMRIVKGSTLEALPTPSFLGHRFEGWHDAPTAGSRIEAPLTLEDDLILYGQWRAADFVFEFDSTGGSAIADQFFYFGDTVGVLPTPVRTGYEFMGWFDRPIGGFKPHPTDLVVRSQTLFAQWRVRTHIVTFDGQGGSLVSSQGIDFGESLGALPTPHKLFHSFEGWFLDPSENTKIESDHVIVQDTTLYAGWTVQRVQIRFEVSGGRALSPRSQNFGTPLGILPVPTHPDKSFVGWTLDSAGRRSVNAQTVTTGDMTLFAQWRSRDARASALSRSAGTIDNDLTPDGSNHFISLRADTPQVRITFIPKDSGATVQMRTATSQDFQTMSSIRLDVEKGQARILQIRVISQCGQNSRLHQVTIERAGN